MYNNPEATSLNTNNYFTCFFVFYRNLAFSYRTKKWFSRSDRSSLTKEDSHTCTCINTVESRRSTNYNRLSCRLSSIKLKQHCYEFSMLHISILNIMIIFWSSSVCPIFNESQNAKIWHCYFFTTIDKCI